MERAAAAASASAAAVGLQCAARRVAARRLASFRRAVLANAAQRIAAAAAAAPGLHPQDGQRPSRRACGADAGERDAPRGLASAEELPRCATHRLSFLAVLAAARLLQRVWRAHSPLERAMATCRRRLRLAPRRVRRALAREVARLRKLARAGEPRRGERVSARWDVDRGLQRRALHLRRGLQAPCAATLVQCFACGFESRLSGAGGAPLHAWNVKDVVPSHGGYQVQLRERCADGSDGALRLLSWTKFYRDTSFPTQLKEEAASLRDDLVRRKQAEGLQRQQRRQQTFQRGGAAAAPRPRAPRRQRAVGRGAAAGRGAQAEADAAALSGDLLLDGAPDGAPDGGQATDAEVAAVQCRVASSSGYALAEEAAALERLLDRHANPCGGDDDVCGWHCCAIRARAINRVEAELYSNAAPDAADTRRVVGAYKSVMDQETPVRACGSCGIRDPTLSYAEYVLGEHSTSALLFTGAPADAMPRRWHLHDRLVHHSTGDPARPEPRPRDSSAEFIPATFLCPGCHRAAESPEGDEPPKKPPLCSLAGGVDFGSASSLEAAASPAGDGGGGGGGGDGTPAGSLLPPLSGLEQLLLARARVYAVLIKVRVPDGMRDDARRRRLKAAVITFPHDAAEVAEGAFGDEQDIARFLHGVEVAFVGPSGTVRDLEHRALQRVVGEALRPHVIYNYLSVRRGSGQEAAAADSLSTSADAALG